MPQSSAERDTHVAVSEKIDQDDDGKDKRCNL